MKKRALTLILAALCLSSVYGCGKQDDTEETDTQSVETVVEETESEPSRPKPSSEGQKFGGASFRVLYRFGGYAYNCNDVTAPDGLTGEVVNDIVYHRCNRKENGERIEEFHGKQMNSPKKNRAVPPSGEQRGSLLFIRCRNNRRL